MSLSLSRLPRFRLSGLIGVLFACFAATFVGPYTYHLYHVVVAYSNSHVPYFMIQELSAFDFKTFTHYVLLLLAPPHSSPWDGGRKWTCSSCRC